MKLPRDLSGKRLVHALCQHWEYREVHRVGSHIILQTENPSHHRLSVPDHKALRRHGQKLGFDEKGRATCPESGLKYRKNNEAVFCEDPADDQSLSDALRVGKAAYEALKLGVLQMDEESKEQ